MIIKNKKKFFIMFIIGIISIILVCLFNFMDYLLYGIIFTIFFFILFVISYIRGDDEQAVYKCNLKNILKTYDVILVKVDNIPEFDLKTVAFANTIDDLLNAQIEIRKPIYYYLDECSSSFILIDEKVTLIYVLKQNNESESTLINFINENTSYKKKEKKLKEIEEIDKTTIIEVNNKEFKISPVRKKFTINTTGIIELPKLKK